MFIRDLLHVCGDIAGLVDVSSNECHSLCCKPFLHVAHKVHASTFQSNLIQNQNQRRSWSGGDHVWKLRMTVLGRSREAVEFYEFYLILSLVLKDTVWNLPECKSVQQKFHGVRFPLDQTPWFRHKFKYSSLGFLYWGELMSQFIAIRGQLQGGSLPRALFLQTLLPSFGIAFWANISTDRMETCPDALIPMGYQANALYRRESLPLLSNTLP